MQQITTHIQVIDFIYVHIPSTHRINIEQMQKLSCRVVLYYYFSLLFSFTSISQCIPSTQLLS